MTNQKRPRTKAEAVKRFDNRNADSKFIVWFEAQYGTEPLPAVSVSDLVEKIESMSSELIRVKQQLERKELWEAYRDAALKAWCARSA